MRQKLLSILLLSIFVLLPACDTRFGADPELPFAQELQQALDESLEQYGGMGICDPAPAAICRNWSKMSAEAPATPALA